MHAVLAVLCALRRNVTHCFVILLGWLRLHSSLRAGWIDADDVRPGRDSASGTSIQRCVSLSVPVHRRSRKGRPERAPRLFVERSAQYWELTVLQDMLRLDSIPILCKCER